MAFEVQGSMGSSTECFIFNLCKKLSVTKDEPKARMFLKQRISVAIEAGNAACALCTVSDIGGTVSNVSHVESLIRE